MRNKILAAILFLCLIFPAYAHHGTEFVEMVPTKFVSNNIVFVIDGSSTMRNSKGLKPKFYRAWQSITSKLAGDEWYFSAYLFGDKGKEKFYPWVAAGGKRSVAELTKLYKWSTKSRDVRSFGNAALSMAIKGRNPLNKNKMMYRTLTVILITDGGFTEAIGPTGYSSSYQAVANAQQWREGRGLFEATILTIGIENKIYWSSKVKRPDAECQTFLQTLGTKYNGGYYLVRDKKE